MVSRWSCELRGLYGVQKNQAFLDQALVSCWVREIWFWAVLNDAHLLHRTLCRYYLYTTRLGYRLHLRRLSRRRHTAHSITQPLTLSGKYSGQSTGSYHPHYAVEFTVIPLPILGDNYCYVIVDDASKVAVAIDAADPEALKVSQP